MAFLTQVVHMPTVDSTMSEVARRAAAGAAEGLVVLANEQTAGRGRRGNPYQSLSGKGLYLSLLLRPDLSSDQLTELTAWTAVAICEAIEQGTGLQPGIKWTNDIILNGRKLGGILTELKLAPSPAVIIGVGLNVSQTHADFGPALRDTATSLFLEGANVSRPALEQTVIAALENMYRAFPLEKEAYLAAYRTRCVTVGREAVLLRSEGRIPVFATHINDDFSLTVRHPDGTRETVSAGEVSVRGLMGYVDGGN